MSIYYFRPVMPGICAECGEPYPALVGRVHLTAKGIVHPGCDKDTPVVFEVPAPPPPKPRKAVRHRLKPTKKQARLKVVPTDPRVDDVVFEDDGNCVCRKCWTVHPTKTRCVK
jgi:hypothetical protein